ncbi:transmembrane protein 200A-like [Branchiostoma lanceolatum]|uniref:transmembrane protein 200A-like n=1 Tax=Branchiostoma lanceolatum TaxID=7740 RepID=UPI003451246E
MMGRGALAGARLASERKKRTLKLQKQGTRKLRRITPRPAKTMVIKGRIKLLSPYTVCVLLGFCVLAVGVVMCMFAYDYVEVDVRNNNNSSSTAEMEAGRSFIVNRDLLRDFRLAGPLIVGLGVFAMLCGVTALLEDRDRRTKRIIIREPTDEIREDVGPILPEVSCKAYHPDYTPVARLAKYRLPRFTVGSCPNLRYQPDSPAHLNPLRGYMKSVPSPVPVRDLYRFQPLRCIGLGETHDLS